MPAAERLLYAKVKNANDVYCLVNRGDRILVALSGGIDSLLMLDALCRLRDSGVIQAEMVAAHIVTNGIDYHIDQPALNAYCGQRGVPLEYRSFVFDKNEKSLKSPCFYCSWQRRKLLFAMCREFNCNKLAMGHHADDALETLMLNMCRHKSISAMPASLPMFNAELHIIRPLILLFSSEIKTIAASMGVQALVTRCSLAGNTNRSNASQLLDYAETLFPGARGNMFAAMSAVYEKYLPVQCGKSACIDHLNVIHDTHGQ